MSEHEFQPTSMLSGRCEFCNRPADEHDDVVTLEEFSDSANWHPIEEHPYLKMVNTGGWACACGEMLDDR